MSMVAIAIYSGKMAILKSNFNQQHQCTPSRKTALKNLSINMNSGTKGL